MAFGQIIPPGTGAVSVGTATEFDATTQSLIVVAADKLATTETATVFAKVNGSYVPASNMQGTAAGLTATVASVTLPGGFIYAFSKAATASACGVYVSGVPYR